MPLNLPNNNLNTGFNSRPIPANLGSLRSSNSLPGRTITPGSPLNRKTSPRKSVLDQVDISKVGKGYLMTEGTYGTNSGVKRFNGLKGQLAKVRHEGRRSVTKNLSHKNMEQMHDLLAGPISRSAVSSGTYISRRDRIEIMKKSRELAKQADSGFTREDRKDLLKIVDSMRKQYRDSLFNNEDDSNPHL